jgi:hypothetical protein
MSIAIAERHDHRDDLCMQDIRQGICPLCGHDEVVEASAADFVGEAGPARPMSVTYEIG